MPALFHLIRPAVTLLAYERIMTLLAYERIIKNRVTQVAAR
jgi:hypothetical protein